MAFQFRTNESVPQGMRRIVGAQIDKALGELDQRDETDRDAVVHAIRKRFKKIRALIRLTQGGLGRKVAAREKNRFRDAARPLSEVRDAGVIVPTLDQLAQGAAGRGESDAWGPVREALIAHQAKRTQQVLDEENGFAEVAETLAEARQQVKRWDVSGDDWDILQLGVRWIYKKGREAFREATAAPTDLNLHEWRKRVKDLGAALTLLQPIRPGYTQDRVHKAVQLAELLGDDHDLAVLRDTLQALGEEGGVANSTLTDPVGPRLDERRAELQQAALSLGRDLYGERTRVFVARVGAYWRAWKAEAEAARFDPP